MRRLVRISRIASSSFSEQRRFRVDLGSLNSNWSDRSCLVGDYFLMMNAFREQVLELVLNCKVVRSFIKFASLDEIMDLCDLWCLA